MSTVELLNTRIKTAKRNEPKQKIGDLQLPECVPLLNPKLAKLALEQKIHARGSFEKVFGFEEPNTRDFLFTSIKTKVELLALETHLKKYAKIEPEWPFSEWLRGTHEDGYIIIAVRLEGEPKPAGFATVRTNLAIEIPDEENSARATTYLSLSLDTVYVAPAHREKGYSQALSWAAAQLANDITYALAEWPDPDRRHLEKYPVEIFISGEAHSPGGARYLSRTVDYIETNTEFFNPKSTWNFLPIISNHCDFSDYPDEGFSLRR